MKLRNPLLIKAAAFGLAGILKSWLGTLRYRLHETVPGVQPKDAGNERFIYTFWHETLLVPAMAYSHQNAYVLISRHADGELIAQICRHLGIRVVRGSTTRDGAAALLSMMNLAQKSHIAITPDGPRGPRRVVQLGAVKLASNTGRPIVPAGFAFGNAWRAGSWDRFAVPMPMSSAVCVSAAPMHVPPNISRRELETYRLRLQEAMLDATHQAEDWARSA